MLVKPIIPVLEYVVFYDYIRNELCVNKGNKAMKCNGKCHLKKELAKASEGSEKQGKNSVRTFSVESNIVFFQKIEPTFFKEYSSNEKQRSMPYYNDLYKHLFCDNMLKPPVYLS